MKFIYSAANDCPAESIAETTKQSLRDQAGAILDAAVATTKAPDGGRRVRHQETVDVIVVEPNQHGLGWTGYACEIGFARTEFRNHLTLVEFAHQHFGSGILRKVATNRYAVLIRKKQAPVAWGDEFDRPRAA
jgi:hypothetical protein